MPRSGNGHSPFALTDSLQQVDKAAASPTNGAPATDGRDARPSLLTRLAVRIDGRFVLLPTADIRYLEARGNYVRLHMPNGVYELRVSLGTIHARLEPAQFMRVHRSLVANIAAIAEISPRTSGRHVIVLCDGTRITTSRTYRNELRKLLYNRR